MDMVFTKGGGVTFERLMTTELGVVELDVPIDCFTFVLGTNPSESTPYLGLLKNISNDLAVSLS